MPPPLAPPLHPATREPVGPDDLAPLFPMGLIVQEVSDEQWMYIPAEGNDTPPLWAPPRPRGVGRAGDRHPRRGHRHPPTVAPPPARARRAVGESAPHAGPHLLQG